MNDRPLASIVILTWNARALVGPAIDSSLAQTAGPVEVLVCDNASRDGTPEFVAEAYGDRVRLIWFPENLGYTGGYNRALALARGRFLLLLNPDARLAPDFLEAALPAFDDPRVGIVAGRLVRPDGTTLDSTGQFLARSRKTIDRGFGRAFDPRRDRDGPVLAACGAAALYRREMVEDIADGGAFFDPDYFAFHEDLEIGWRAWRAGWRAVHVGAAVAVHERAGGRRRGRAGLALARPPEVLAHIVKNRWLAILRHDRPLAFFADLPFILGRDLALHAAMLVRAPAVYRHLWRHRGAAGRALRRRREDRRREGRWGAWSRRVPPRGIWRVRGGTVS